MNHLEEIARARAHILRIAEPEDPIVNLAIDSLGPIATADLLSGHTDINSSSWQELLVTQLEKKTSSAEQHQIIQRLKDRVKRWNGRAHMITSDQEEKMARSLDAWFCIPEHHDRPKQLNDLPGTRPYGIWGRRDRALLKDLRLNQAVAVVGSRDITQYGTSVAGQLAAELTQAGFSVVSGGAFGVDAVAHRAALSTAGSPLPTVALMACGVDRLYPKHNDVLLGQIIEQGLLLSEVPLGYAPTRWRFLQRNRMIAALSALTVVVEARWRSGALNTAHHALEIGREVRAVPGSVFSPNSQGCHKLLRDGLATVVTDSQEIIDDVRGTFSETPEQMSASGSSKFPLPEDLSEIQARVWDSLPLRSPAPIDHISSMSGVSLRETMRALSQLSSLGLARQQDSLWHKVKK